MNNLEKYLKKLGACKEAREWAASYSTLQEAWDACENGSWMLWLVAKRAGGEAWSNERKPVLAAALDCAETVKHLWPEKSAARIAGAVDVLRQWIAGTASIERAKEAREKLKAAAYDAAAAYAADAAGDDAAALWIIRREIAWEEIEAALTRPLDAGVRAV